MRAILRRMPSLLLPALSALLLGTAAPLAAQEDAPAAGTDEAAATEAAEAAALDWLEIVDSGDYEASLEEGAAPLRDAVTLAQWSAALNQARGPLEPFGERTRITAQYTTELPNAPAGEYVVLQYRTEVATGDTVTETVVPMLEDGEWKVSGYFVQP